MSPIEPSTPSEILLQHLPEHLAAWLEEIPDCAELSSETAEERLFPDPADGKNEEITGDWKAFVQPELSDLFRSAREVVRKDLERLEMDEEGYRLSIPRQHFESWLGALNQVRLSIAEVNHLGEEEMSPDPNMNPSSERDLAVLKVHFFGYLQELLVAALSGGQLPENPGDA